MLGHYSLRRVPRHCRASRPLAYGGHPSPVGSGAMRSGVPLRTALKRIPDAVSLPVDKEAYDAASTGVMAALRSFGFPVDVLG